MRSHRMRIACRWAAETLVISSLALVGMMVASVIGAQDQLAWFFAQLAAVSFMAGWLLLILGRRF